MPKAYFPSEPGPTVVEVFNTGAEIQLRSTPSGNILWRGSFATPAEERMRRQAAHKFGERFGWLLIDKEI